MIGPGYFSQVISNYPETALRTSTRDAIESQASKTVTVAKMIPTRMLLKRSVWKGKPRFPVLCVNVQLTDPFLSRQARTSCRMSSPSTHHPSPNEFPGLEIPKAKKTPRPEN